MSLQNNELISVLENEEAKDFIIKHLDDNLEMLALKFSSRSNFNLSRLLQLLKIYQKAKHKLPTFVCMQLAINNRSYQQASSEMMAEYKADLLQGGSIIDLSAGIGVDSLAFSKIFERVVAVDPDPHLHELATYNLQKLGITHIERRCGLAQEQKLDSFDWVYLDPDRRSKGERKILIEELEPDLSVLVPKALKLNKKIAIKLSPLLELEAALSLWPDDLREIRVVSQDQEVKEVLLLLWKSKDPCTLVAENLGKGAYKLEAAAGEINHSIAQHWDSGKYLYFPHAALSKSRLANFYASQLGMHRIKGFEAYQSSELHPMIGFKGFKILQEHKRDLKKLKKWLKDQKLSGLNIWSKGGQRSASELAKKLGIKEGGENYLIELAADVNRIFYCELLF